MKRREPFPNRQVIDLTDVRLTSLGCPRLLIARIPRFRRKQIINELPEIAFVITKSMRADVAFVAQMVEEWSTKLIEHAARGQVLSSVLSQSEATSSKSGLLYTRSRVLTTNPLRARTRAFGRVFTLTAITWW